MGRNQDVEQTMSQQPLDGQGPTDKPKKDILIIENRLDRNSLDVRKFANNSSAGESQELKNAYGSDANQFHNGGIIEPLELQNEDSRNISMISELEGDSIDGKDGI